MCDTCYQGSMHQPNFRVQLITRRQRQTLMIARVREALQLVHSPKKPRSILLAARERRFQWPPAWPRPSWPQSWPTPKVPPLTRRNKIIMGAVLAAVCLVIAISTGVSLSQNKDSVAPGAAAAANSGLPTTAASDAGAHSLALVSFILYVIASTLPASIASVPPQWQNCSNTCCNMNILPLKRVCMPMHCRCDCCAIPTATLQQSMFMPRRWCAFAV